MGLQEGFQGGRDLSINVINVSGKNPFKRDWSEIQERGLVNGVGF